MKRLDPSAVAAYRGRLLRAALALCGSRDSAEDLVQETLTRILARPRLLRGAHELAYLMQALRNTFVSVKRTSARRPRVVMTLEELNIADGRAAAPSEDAVIAAQLLPAIDQLPEAFRLALVAVDVVGLSYREAARVLDAPEATITTRLYRARQRVARELDSERFCAGRSESTCSRRPGHEATGKLGVKSRHQNIQHILHSGAPTDPQRLRVTRAE
jgi:RNA polymerase sigma-70 factor (ECF subfamily)